VENDQPDSPAAVATIDRALDAEGPVTPRRVRATLGNGDRLFRVMVRCAAATVLAITGGIGLFLAIKALPVLRVLGWSFFTETEWNPETGHIGIAAVLVGTLVATGRRNSHGED